MFMEVDIVVNEPEPEIFHLIQDDDGHWYVININDDENFRSWVEATERDLDSDFDFEGCRLSGSPTRVRFHRWWEE